MIRKDEDETVVLGDLLKAYDQLDETGRRVFSCAFLHVWAENTVLWRAKSAGSTGGSRRFWDREALEMPVSLTFGDDLDLPLPGLFAPPEKHE